MKQLKDPESARFDDDGTRIYVKNGLVCGGTVNAKNSYGGYAGEQDYFYKRGSGAILAVDDHLNVIDMMGECSSALTASINASPKSK